MISAEVAPSAFASDGESVLDVVDFSGGFVGSGGELTPVLDQVSFSIRRSSLTAIVGETGSGKSLMALAILGVPPRSFRRTSGVILFEGADLLMFDEKAMRGVRGSQISVVFQDALASLNPVFTVGSQISDVCRVHQGVNRKEALTRTEELLERVKVPEPRRRMRQYPHEFSGGMAQRALLAMALICEPTLLVLDEPTTGLDVTTQADIVDLIVDLNRNEGMSTCLITHDLGIVAESCDHVIVMRDGHVRESGTCEQIITSPQDAYTRELIDASRFGEVIA
jgi:ABC-type glutathione transport system ATPase component